MKNLIIAEDRKQAKVAIDLIKKGKVHKYILLSLSKDAGHILNANNIPYRLESYYINSDDLKDIVHDAWTKVNSWFKSSPKVEKELDFHSVNLGSAYSLRLLKYFSWFNKLQILIERVLSKERIDTLIILEPSLRRIIKDDLRPVEDDILANRLLYDIGIKRHLQIRKINYIDFTLSAFPRINTRLLAKNICKKIVYIFYAHRLQTPRDDKRQTFMFFAGLDYIKDIILSLKNKGEGNIIFLDLSVQLRNMRFCLEHNITYTLLRTPEKSDSLPFSQEVFSAFCTIGEAKFENALHERYISLNVKMPFIRDFIVKLEDFFYKYRPNKIILDQDLDEIKKTTVLIARKMGIETAVISHGIPPGHYAIASTPLTADNLIVGGNATKDIYITEGVKPDRVHILGDPRYDRIPQILRTDKKLILRELGLNRLIRDNDKIVLFALTTLSPRVSTKVEWFFEEEVISRYYESFEYVLQYLAGQKNIFVIIKAHQRTDAGSKQHFYRLIGESKLNSKNYIYLTHSDTLKLIRISNLVLSHWSNVCMESIFLRKPTIIVDYVGKTDAYDIVDGGPAVKVRNPQELRTAAHKMLDNGLSEENFIRCDKIIKQYANNLTGKATEKITDFIMNYQNQ